MSVDGDGPPPGAAALAWEIICTCRRISPSTAAVVALLRRLPGGLAPPNQRWFLAHCVEDALGAAFPRGAEMERKLVRSVVMAVEEDGQELSEVLMAAFSQRLVAGGGGAGSAGLKPSCGFKLYAYASPLEDAWEAVRPWEERTLEQARGGGGAAAAGGPAAGLLALHVSHDMLAGGTGCFDWEAGMFLSEFVLSAAQQEFTGRRCLELGAGAGMTGVALARAGAAHVLCTDGDLDALANCERNLRLNGVAPAAAATERLRWEDGAAGLGPGAPPVDVVVGADLTYDPEPVPTLMALMRELLTGAGGRAPASAAFLATTYRSEATLQKFLDAVAAEPALAMEDVSAEAAAATARGVRFSHAGALEAARPRILLHKLTAALPAICPFSID